MDTQEKNGRNTMSDTKSMFGEDIPGRCIAEAIGTAVLVFVGCGAALALGCNGAVADGAYVGTALAFGIAVIAMAYSVGNVSGCHLNPAVSLAMLVSGRMGTGDFLAYVASQCAGAAIGCVPLHYLFGGDCGFGANALAKGVADPLVASLLIECILTFVFVFAILGVTDKEENSPVAGLVIGLTLVGVHLVGIRFTGTSVNPARSLLPALFAGGDALACAWVFVVAPLVGGALAALCYKAIASK